MVRDLYNSRLAIRDTFIDAVASVLPYLLKSIRAKDGYEVAKFHGSPQSVAGTIAGSPGQPLQATLGGAVQPPRRLRRALNNT